MTLEEIHFRREYKEQAMRTLEQYQFLETALKMLIQNHYHRLWLSAMRAGDAPAKKPKTDKWTLGKAVEHLDELGTHAALVQSIRPLVPKRNKVAHTSLTVVYLGPTAAAKYATKIADLAEQERELVKIITGIFVSDA